MEETQSEINNMKEKSETEQKSKSEIFKERESNDFFNCLIFWHIPTEVNFCYLGN